MDALRRADEAAASRRWAHVIEHLRPVWVATRDPLVAAIIETIDADLSAAEPKLAAARERAADFRARVEARGASILGFLFARVRARIREGRDRLRGTLDALIRERLAEGERDLRPRSVEALVHAQRRFELLARFGVFAAALVGETGVVVSFRQLTVGSRLLLLRRI